MSSADAIRRAVVWSAVREQEFALVSAKLERDQARDAEARRTFVVEHCEPATPREYAAWLDGYLNRGGEISNVHHYPMTNRGVTVVGSGDPTRAPLETAPSDLSWLTLRSRPTRVPSLYGALSLHVIVPVHVAFAPADLPHTFHGGHGHSTFYFMSGYRLVGRWVPIFPDVSAILSGRDGDAT